MDVFAEFEQRARELSNRSIPYALVGGVAMAFHIRPRFTKDIDFLIKSAHAAPMTALLMSMGYLPPADPWRIPRTHLALHRYVKSVPDDEFFVDVLVAESPEMEAIVDRALVVAPPNHPPARIAQRADIIQLKKLRSSPLDQADIALLQDE